MAIGGPKKKAKGGTKKKTRKKARSKRGLMAAIGGTIKKGTLQA